MWGVCTSGSIDEGSELAKTGRYEIFTQTDSRLPDDVNQEFGGAYDALFFVGAAVASPPANA